MDALLFGFFVLLIVALSVASYVFPIVAGLALVRLAVFQVLRLHALGQSRPALLGAARALGLAVHRNSLVLGDEIGGPVEGVELRIRPVNAFGWRWRGLSPGSLEIVLRTDAPLPPRMVVRSRGLELAGAPSLGDPVRTHEPVFDQELSAYGRAVDVAARLDASLRRRLLDVVSRAEIHAEGDQITLITRRPIIVPIVLVKLLERVAALGRDLAARGPTIPDRLLANALSDPTIAVRYHNLDMLLREYPGSPQALEAQRIAWDAPERGIRYLAAIRRGAEGLPFLFETVEVTTESPSLRILAMRHLAHHAPRASVLPMLRRLLKDDAPAVVKAALELIGRLKDREAIPALTALAARWSTAESTRVLAIEAVGNIGDPTTERFLLDFLPGGRFELACVPLKLAAATAIGRLGSRGSLRALRRLVRMGRQAKELASVARASIARIEVRCGPGGRGQLSIAGESDPRGAVSIAGAFPGALSLPSRAGVRPREKGELGP